MGGRGLQTRLRWSAPYPQGIRILLRVELLHPFNLVKEAIASDVIQDDRRFKDHPAPVLQKPTASPRPFWLGGVLLDDGPVEDVTAWPSVLP
jgi:hypothetical protein